ncbi:hypothetical protein A7Q26_19170 [Sphingobium sp. TCM1]|nr:hypothetical protein A7Q26_19170 [Sphingobium sp. TCM1]
MWHAACWKDIEIRLFRRRIDQQVSQCSGAVSQWIGQRRKAQIHAFPDMQNTLVIKGLMRAERLA